MGRERDVKPGEGQPTRNQKTAIRHHSPFGGVELGCTYSPNLKMECEAQ